MHPDRLPPPASQLRDDGSLRHLLTLQGLPTPMLKQLLDRAAHFSRPLRQAPARSLSLQGRTIALMFAEPSTRTRVSFELAARRLGAERLHLLTDTAAPFFRVNGYAEADRAAAPPAVAASREFTALCPASATFLVKAL